jgi:radical SAM-linked protein
MVRDKVRIRFRKDGALRLISHHDLMRCFERMLRRADLPVHCTAGFNPKPRLVFALSLGLGIAGGQEVAELELDEEIPPEEIHRRLCHQAPDGLQIQSVERIDPKSTAQVGHVCYRLRLPADRRDEAASRAADLMAQAQCPVTRTKPRPRQVDIRPYLRGLRLTEDQLEMEFAVTPNGTARADEVLFLLGLGDLLDNGAVLERIILELKDENKQQSSPRPQAAAEARQVNLKEDS